jgi:hypothetical protein
VFPPSPARPLSIALIPRLELLYWPDLPAIPPEPGSAPIPRDSSKRGHEQVGTYDDPGSGIRQGEIFVGSPAAPPTGKLRRAGASGQALRLAKKQLDTKTPVRRAVTEVVGSRCPAQTFSNTAKSYPRSVSAPSLRPFPTTALNFPGMLTF